MDSVKSQVGKEDLKLWDGVNGTFERRTSTGGKIILTSIGNEVDILQVYGEGTSRTSATLSEALGVVGTSYSVVFTVSPGTWAITADITVPSNVVLHIPKGASFSISSGITLTLNGPIIAGDYQIFSGDGTAAIGISNSENRLIWWATLAKAIAGIGSTSATLLLNNDDTLTASATIPATLSVIPMKGNVITTGGNTFTINGQVAGAPIFQWISGTGTVFSGQDFVLVNWFGTNSAAVQAAFTSVLASSGTVRFLNATYTLTTAVTFLSASTTGNRYIIEGNGAVLDWSASGLTSGDLLAFGATSQANAHDKELDEIRNLMIIGPEPALTTTPTTSCVGLSLEYALRTRLSNVAVRKCYEGIKTNYVFDLQADNCLVRECYVGLRIDDTSTYALWNNFQAVDNRYGIVIKPGTSGAVVSNQTFVNPRMEGNDVGCAMDGGTNSAYGLRSIHFYNTYAEGITYDLFREGLQWTIANPQTRNAVSVGYVINTVIRGGEWSGVTWSGTCAAIAWPSSSATVRGGEYRVPVLISSCVNYPGKATFQNLIDIASGLGTDISPTSLPGYGVLVIRGSDGDLTIGNNLISSVTRNSTGNYTITLRETATSASDIAVGATCDGGFVTVATASGSTTTVVLICYDHAGNLIDPSRVRAVIHAKLT